MNTAGRLARSIERAVDVLCMVMVLLMVAAMAWQVFGRYVLGHSPAWAEELARYLMVWLTFLGAVGVLRAGGHLTVTALPDRLGPQAITWLLWVRDALMLGLCGLLAWASWRFALLNASQESAAMEIPMTIPNGAMAIGFGLLALQIVLARLAGEPFKALPGDDIA